MSDYCHETAETCRTVRFCFVWFGLVILYWISIAWAPDIILAWKGVPILEEKGRVGDSAAKLVEEGKLQIGDGE